MRPHPSNQAPTIAEGLFSFDIGGSERVGVDLALQFAARGYRVLCFAFYGTDGPMRAELEAGGVRCIDLDYLRRPRYIRRATYQVEFLRFLRRERVAALHVHHATALVLCGLAARLAGIKHVVMTEHALHQLKERPRYLKEATYYCRYAHDITAVHAGIADYFHETMAVPRDRLHVITNGVRMRPRDEAARAHTRAGLGLGQNDFVFLFAGRLEAVKDVSTLLAAVALLPDQIRARARLLIAGDGSERAMLEEKSRSLGLQDAVRFLGARTDIPVLLAAADGFVMTSRTEGLPMALIEAMAASVPCIATAVGGIPELFADGCGLLTAAGQPQMTADAMLRLIAEPDTHASLREQALRKARALYDLDPVVTRYLQLLGLPSHWPPSADHPASLARRAPDAVV